MPYDKKTRDALQAYYETHDFTGNIPAFDDKKIYARTTSDLCQKREKTILNAGRIKNNHSCTRPRITTHSCR